MRDEQSHDVSAEAVLGEIAQCPKGIGDFKLRDVAKKRGWPRQRLAEVISGLLRARLIERDPDDVFVLRVSSAAEDTDPPALREA